MSRGQRCPHCGGAMSPLHVRDTGDVAVKPDHACPWLWERRKGPRARALEALNASLVIDQAQAVIAAAPRRAGDAL